MEAYKQDVRIVKVIDSEYQMDSDGHVQFCELSDGTYCYGWDVAAWEGPNESPYCVFYFDTDTEALKGWEEKLSDMYLSQSHNIALAAEHAKQRVNEIVKE